MDPKTLQLDSEPYGRLLLPLVGLMVLLGGIASRSFLKAEPPKVSLVSVEAPPEPLPPAPSRPKPAPPAPVAALVAKPEAPQLDQAAVARAEASLDATTRSRALAESRLADLELALEKAKQEGARDEALLLTLEERAKDIARRVSFANAEGGKILGQRDRLRQEVATLAKVAKPKVKALLDKSPVAKPIKGDEVHFEVRRNRVTPIDLDRLVEMVKEDANIRMKVGGIRTRPITASVGPVGMFELKYELGLMVSDSGGSGLDVTSVGFGLRGWELVPISEDRGETLEEVVKPGSHYANAVIRLVPGKTSVTFWVYPDGFQLYRRLRDDLHARGYLVAARPLPEGLAIQASPSGSASAAQ